MSIDTLILYGSCAREDEDAESDIDLFALTTAEDHNMVVKQKVNLAIYPLKLALNMAENGDLFLLHIVEEGKVIYDSEGHFDKLRSSFSYRSTYRSEIIKASDLGWTLIELAPNSNNHTLINRRMAWCVRTILIAMCAEKRTPRFSASSLAKYSGDASVTALIKNKNSDRLDRNILLDFKNFLHKFGSPPPEWIGAKNIELYKRQFLHAGNSVGLQTMKLISTSDQDSSY
ncbi:nucleotidyltransferase domain-containing protein [Herbaspirillum sp. GCM10030257]|uniref:anti-phage Hailong system nucleotidyltransferase HalB n=1 Tax=Herbaspirillum sp. GCM10030257 TaxID=3273393 RepID=UPI00360A10D2